MGALSIASAYVDDPAFKREVFPARLSFFIYIFAICAVLGFMVLVNLFLVEFSLWVPQTTSVVCREYIGNCLIITITLIPLLILVIFRSYDGVIIRTMWYVAKHNKP